MADFLIGILTGALLMLAVLQLVTKKSISIVGIIDKSEDPERYRNLTLAYICGSISGLSVYLINL